MWPMSSRLLTALMLVSDRLELAVKAEDSALVERLQRNCGVSSCWWRTSWVTAGEQPAPGRQ